MHPSNSTPDSDLIVASPQGLYCPQGDFHIDPWAAVPRAVITHAHSDHLRAGSGSYHLAAAGAGLARARLPGDAQLTAVPYRARFDLGGVSVSLHPAGHVLGSAQVRLEHQGRVWVVSGDYKRQSDPTCEPFEPIVCEVFVSEATFGLPAYRWPAAENVVRGIFEWWMQNRRRGAASVLFAYALGKAQRVLAELVRHTAEPVYVHGALAAITEVYRRAGVTLLPTLPIADSPAARYAGALILAPPSALGSAWLRRFGAASTGYCSGWMRVRGDRRRRGVDRGFVLSDHADWPALLSTCKATQARRLLFTHGFSDTLSRYFRDSGLEAAALSTPYGEEA